MAAPRPAAAAAAVTARNGVRRKGKQVSDADTIGGSNSNSNSNKSVPVPHCHQSDTPKVGNS